MASKKSALPEEAGKKPVSGFALFRKENNARIESSVPSQLSPDSRAKSKKAAFEHEYSQLNSASIDEYDRRAKEMQQQNLTKAVPASTTTTKVPIQSSTARPSWIRSSSSATPSSSSASIKENRGNSPQEPPTSGIQAQSQIAQGSQKVAMPSGVRKGNGNTPASIFLPQNSASKASPKNPIAELTNADHKQTEKESVPAARPPTSSATSKIATSKSAGGAEKPVFFMSKAEKEAKEQSERERQVALKAAKREQEFQEQRERQKIEDRKAYKGKGDGCNIFFPTVQKSISASVEARQNRMDSIDGVHDDTANGVDYIFQERYPAVGLPPTEGYLLAHSSRCNANDIPSKRTCITDSADASNLGELQLILSDCKVYTSSSTTLFSDADVHQHFNKRSLFSSYLHAISPIEYRTSSANGQIIDLREDGDASRPIEISDDVPSDSANHAVSSLKSMGCVQALVDMYRPTKANDFIGNTDSIKRLQEWLMAWAKKRPSQSTKKKIVASHRKGRKYDSDSSDFDDSEDDAEDDDIFNVATVYGPSGSGKTSLVLAMAKEVGFNVIEIKTNEVRSGVAIKKLCDEATKSTGVGASSLNLIVFDEIDLQFREDVGFHAAIHSLAKTTRTPIVLTTESSKLRLLKDISTEFMLLERPDSLSTAIRIAPVLKAASPLSTDKIEHLSRILSAFCSSDIRSCLHQLHFLIPSLGLGEFIDLDFNKFLLDAGFDFAYMDNVADILVKLSETLAIRNDALPLPDCSSALFIPSIYEVSPKGGDRRGGFVVTVEGENFLQRSATGDFLNTRVFVNHLEVDIGDVCVISDTELVFIAPPCLAGGVLSVIIALELTGLPTKANIFLRSDIVGSPSALHFEPEPALNDIRRFYALKSSSISDTAISTRLERTGQIEDIDDSSDEEFEPLASGKRKAKTISTGVAINESEPVQHNLKRTRKIFNANEGLSLVNVDSIKGRMSRALKSAMEHAHAEPFLNPVTLEMAPDYFDVILKPMDFCKVEASLSAGEYYTSEPSIGLQAMLDDVRLIHNNCVSYNGKTSHFSTSAALVCRVFEDMLSSPSNEVQDNDMLSLNSNISHVEEDEDEDEDEVMNESCLPTNSFPDSWFKQSLPSKPSAGVLQTTLLAAEKRRRDHVALSTSFRMPVTGQEYISTQKQLLYHSIPEILNTRNATSLSRESARGKLIGELAALEMLSQLHDTWSAADILRTHACDESDGVCKDPSEDLSEDVYEDYYDSSKILSGHIATRLASASVTELAKPFVLDLENSSSPFCPKDTQQNIALAEFARSISVLSQKIKLTELVASGDFSGAKSAPAEPDAERILADARKLENIDEDSSCDMSSNNRKTKQLSKSRLESSDSDEAEFDDEWTVVSPTKKHPISTAILSDFNWRNVGAEFGNGFLRVLYRREAFLNCVVNDISTVEHCKALRCSTVVPRRVILESIPFIGRMLEWESLFFENNSANSNAFSLSSSRRSSRVAPVAQRFPYVTRATKLSDDALMKILQFSKVGEVRAHEIAADSVW